MGLFNEGQKGQNPSQDSRSAVPGQQIVNPAEVSDCMQMERPRTVITLGMVHPFVELVKSIRTFTNPDDGSEWIEIDLSLTRKEGDFFLQMPLEGSFDRTFVDIITRLLRSRYVTIHYNPTEPSREEMKMVIIEDDAQIFIHGIEPK
ncbi:MAG: hypothetical protein R2787_00480 [Saprospiraceae bacterium]